jgi:hypothetical protein
MYYADYEEEGISNISSDGTTATLYTSVEVDGYGQMNYIGGNGCSGLNFNGVLHTPIAVNKITLPDGTSVGGSMSGNGECPDCYISQTNYQSVDNISPGQNYIFQYEAEVLCTFINSVIYDPSGDWSLSWATTYGEWVPGAPAGSCNYNADCTNTRTPKCGSHGWTTNTNQNNACSSIIWNAWLVVTAPSGAWSCYGANSNGLPVTSPGPCTPQ